MHILDYLDPQARLWLTADDSADPPAGGAGGDPPPVGGAGDPPPNGGTGDPPTGAGDPPPVEPPVRTDWRDKQIDRQHRKIKEAEAETERLRAENARLTELAAAAARRAAPPAGDPPPPSPPADTRQPPADTRQPPPPEPDRTRFKDEVRLEVQIENLQNEIKANDTYAKAWPTVFGNFQKLGGIEPPVMGQVLATDDPAYVLMEIGKDPSRYQELLELPANKRQAELIKIALAKPKAAEPPKKPSEAPPPVDALNRGGGGAPPPTGADLYSPELASPDHDDAWFAERMRQKRESVGRPWSVGGKAGGGR